MCVAASRGVSCSPVGPAAALHPQLLARASGVSSHADHWVPSTLLSCRDAGVCAWSPPTAGTQPPQGHRLLAHSSSYGE